MSELITICMSTYNGERFLAKQLDSIEAQTYQNWHLLIHDDGSTDQTLPIIRRFAAKDDRIRIQPPASHQGVTKAFLDLVMVEDADYYMLADQDDEWVPEKLTKMRDFVAAKSHAQPVLAHCGIQFIDAQSNLVPRGDNWLYRGTKFREIALSNNVVGCTTIFNRRLRDLVKAHYNELNFDHLFLHDWFLAMLASGLGTLAYLDEPLVRYRQHANNVIGGNSAKRRLRSLWARVTLQKKLKINLICQQAGQFESLYGEQLADAADRRLCQFLNSLLNTWQPVAQIQFLKRHKLTMHSAARNFQFKIFVLLPLRMRRIFF